MKRPHARTSANASASLCAGFLLAALLAGCMLGPNYERPAVDAPAAFRFEPKEVADTANTAWWRQFNDPVLDQLIDAALANNLNVKVAAANVEQAAGVFTQTRSGLFPQVGYAGTGERARTTESGATRLPDLLPNPQTAYQAALTKRVLHDRSVVMAFRMQRELRRGNAFVALGALHLYGDKGVLALLEQDGYRARRVY